MDKSGPSDRQPADLQLQSGSVVQPLTKAPRGLGGVAPRPASNVEALLEGIAAFETGPVMPAHVTSDVFAFVLDTLSTPILILDRRLHIVFANAAANAVLASPAAKVGPNAVANAGALHRCGNQLTVVAGQARAFADAVNAAGSDRSFTKTMILDGGRALSMVVWLRPVDGALQSSAAVWSRGLVCVSFRVLRSLPAISQALLITHYRLTPRQAEVACHIALGASVSTVAAEMKIEITTLRSHLSEVYRKTGTCQQADLVALMLSLTSPVLE